MNLLKTELNPENASLHKILDNLAVATIVLSAQAQLRYANKAARQLLALTPPEQTLSGQELLHQLPSEEQTSLISACRAHRNDQLSLNLSATSRQNVKRTLQISLQPVDDDSGDLQAILKDMSQYQAASRLPVHFHQAMQQTQDLVMVTDSHGRIEYVNPAFIHQTGYAENDVLGQTPQLLSSGEHDNTFYHKMWKTLRSGQSFRDIFINRRKNGERYQEEKTITPIRDEFGQVSHFVSTGRDITELVNSEQHLDFLRRFDPLTGLPNRQRLCEHFERHVLQRKRAPMALFLIDLDRLSLINDSLGRSAGDDLLKLFSQRLKQRLPEHFIGRLGSDAFLVMAEGIQTPDQAAHMAQQFHQIMALPFELTQAELFISISLGITLYPYDGDQFDELINKADSAMHRCKDNEQGFGFFTEDLTIQTQNRVRLENQLRQALLHRQFHLVFQPRVNLQTGQVQGVEALLRWIHRDGKSTSPAEFIPVLEEIGLITSVGEWALLRACNFASQWLQKGHDLGISVNLSARQLRQDNLPEVINRCLDLTGLPAHKLELELTETSMLADVEHSIAQLEKLKAMGIRIAIDDFGTGYSSLAYLKRLPVHTLKIDRAFIQELSADSTDLDIVRTITQLAHSLKLDVTAEGIENREQLNLIKELGCNEGQGFLLAKPMNEVDLLHWHNHFNLDRVIAGEAS